MSLARRRRPAGDRCHPDVDGLPGERCGARTFCSGLTTADTSGDSPRTDDSPRSDDSRGNSDSTASSQGRAPLLSSTVVGSVQRPCVSSVGHHGLRERSSRTRCRIDRQGGRSKARLRRSTFQPRVVLKDQGKLDEAIVCQKRALALKPLNPIALCNLGVAFRCQGKLDEAIARYEQALAIEPNYPEAISNLGNALKDQGRLDEAIARYEETLVIRPNHPEVLCILALRWGRRANWAKLSLATNKQSRSSQSTLRPYVTLALRSPSKQIYTRHSTASTKL